VELYEQIRREYEHGAGTIRAVARKFGVHRREVRKALASAMPVERRIPERERPKLAAAIPFIDAILESDRKAPRKQRHTAHRIWTRLRREMPDVDVAESTVRQYVRERKTAMGLLGQETFVPQSYSWGGEGQVDWYEGWAEFDGESRKAYLFCLRSMASGGAFHRAYPHANQQAFLEAHELAFAYFGGRWAKAARLAYFLCRGRGYGYRPSGDLRVGLVDEMPLPRGNQAEQIAMPAAQQEQYVS